MKYGLISDIHSNLEALQAVLEKLKEERVDQYVFIGDLVGYGADPRACIEILSDLRKRVPCTCVAGNHDYAVCDMTPYANYAQHAVAAIEWTKAQLDKAQMDFLRDLKLIKQVDGFTIVHANLVDYPEWGYILDIDDAYPNFSLLQDHLCFIGHTHRPITFISGQSCDWFVRDTIQIEKGFKYIINIGSVGQPRDGNPMASFAIYDSQAHTVDIRRTPYNIGQTQKKILNAGLPSLLAERLSLGI